MKSWFASCNCKRSTREEQVDTQNDEATSKDRGAVIGTGKSAAVLESVYYDARSSMTDSMFVPLSLKPGTSLDDRASVIGTSSTSSSPPLQQTPDHSASTVVHENKKEGGKLQSTVIFRNELEETPKVLDSPVGYPGHLTETELDACLEFRRQLKQGDEVYRNMVYGFKAVEEEPYAVCRFLRSRDFNVKKTFQMMDENADLWKQGQSHNFFPDPRVALGGAPESAFLTQLPLVMGGIARNGCPIVYLTTGKIKVEGIECVTSLEEGISNYIWYFAVHKIQRHVAAAQAKDPSRFVRIQLMIVVDLHNLSLPLLNAVLPVLEKVLKILGIFPELLFNVVILNTPVFFSGFWPLIKAFMDPSTAKKFELYSDHAKGGKRLQELISATELASDFDGSDVSTTELVTRDESRVRRQIVELLTSHKRGDVECNFELKGSETAAVAVYTKARDGAEVCLYATEEKNPRNQVTMTRNSNEPKDSAFSRDLAPALCGPGSYRITVKRQSGPPKEHFLIVGSVSQA